MYTCVCACVCVCVCVCMRTHVPVYTWSHTQIVSNPYIIVLQNSLYGVDDVDKANMTCLMWACYHNRVNIAAFLLDKHADKEEKDIDGMTAMHW